MTVHHGMLLGRRITPDEKRDPWHRRKGPGGETASEWHVDCTCGEWGGVAETRPLAVAAHAAHLQDVAAHVRGDGTRGWDPDDRPLGP